MCQDIFAQIENLFQYNFRYVVSKKWFHESTIRLPLVSGTPSPSQIANSTELDERLSDKCMKDLMGTSSKNEKCTVADDCWQVMNSEGTFGYTTTHQVLFFLLGISLGKCRREM